MTKKLFTLLLAVAASVGTMFAWDYEHVQIGDLYYNLDAINKTAEVTYEVYKDTANYHELTAIDIPANVEYNEESYSVIGVGRYSFKSCKKLTSVVIPSGDTIIGSYAFDGCKGLISIEIPNTVKRIGSGVFRNCVGLTSVNIPNSVTNIGGHIFNGCSNLSYIKLKAENPPILHADGFDCYFNIYIPCGTMNAYKTAENWSTYSSYFAYEPLPYIITDASKNGMFANNIDELTVCDDPLVTCTATPHYGYHFTQWADGVTNNPRTITLTQDTTMEAIFAPNKYSINVTCNNTQGSVEGESGSFDYLTEKTYKAVPNYGYHFVGWSDNNTQNPRTYTITADSTFSAIFAKNTYNITTNAAHGNISGGNSAEYLDYVTLTVTSDYGYHFTQWSDGLKDNPRIAQITKDTAFTAEFAYDRVGTCGKDFALVWSYDPTNKVLTIGNSGEFTENMQFGAEAPNEMEELVIGNSVTAIGANAFAGIETLKKVSIGESVKTIGEQAFFNCVNLETIFNYRPTPTNAYSTAFDGVDKFECKLYVLPSSIDMYKAAAVWRDFYYTYAIGAEETTVTTNDVQVEPQDNAATLTWPTSNNAATYTIEITKDGVLFCTLTFNSNGQLTGIAFAPSRDGQAHAPAAIMTANGLQFTVTGLNSGTQYGYNLTAKDAKDQTVATYSGSFTTTSEGETTGVGNVPSDDVPCTKVIRNGQICILRGDKIYTLQGQEVK